MPANNSHGIAASVLHGTALTHAAHKAMAGGGRFLVHVDIEQRCAPDTCRTLQVGTAGNRCGQPPDSLILGCIGGGVEVTGRRCDLGIIYDGRRPTIEQDGSYALVRISSSRMS